MIDLHCHFLPGIDDGPDSVEESLELAEAWLDVGVDQIVATPHVNLKHPNGPETIRESAEKMAAALQAESVNLRVQTGAEISASVAIDMPDEQLEQLTLGDSNWLLVEPPTSSTPFALHGTIFGISGKGWNILLAHPERNPAFQEDLDLLVSLVDGGIKTQVTAGVFSGRYGRTAARTAARMMELDLVHVVASDAHHATLRPPEMSEPLIEAGYGHMVDWLCTEMPAWILDGGEEPPAPARSSVPSRGLLSRFRHRG